MPGRALWTKMSHHVPVYHQLFNHSCYPAAKASGGPVTRIYGQVKRDISSRREKTSGDHRDTLVWGSQGRVRGKKVDGKYKHGGAELVLTRQDLAPLIHPRGWWEQPLPPAPPSASRRLCALSPEDRGSL